MRRRSHEEKTIESAVRSTRQRVTLVEAKALIRAWLASIANEVEFGRKVEVPGFGIFYRAESKARRVRNPATGELMRLPKSYRLGLRASSAQKWTP